MAVVVDQRGVKIKPDRVEVDRGGEIEWTVTSRDVPYRVRIYFSNGSPFDWSASDGVAVQGQPATIAARADEPGEYKYGVRAEDIDRDEVVGDEDPWIIVRR